jgi:hypothetical protein
MHNYYPPIRGIFLLLKKLQPTMDIVGPQKS